MSEKSLTTHAARFAPKQTLVDGKTDLIGLDRAELKALFANNGLEPFRVEQVWSWIYCHGLRDFDQMTNLSKAARQKLKDLFVIARPVVTAEQKSTDGTMKWLLKMPDGHEIEAVYIPEKDRGALCVSSQVGCTNACKFCHTGTQRLVRNLSAGEIVMQVMQARDAIGEWPSTRLPRMISNIVLMGMGEPLYNYDNVAKAVKIIMDESGIAIGKRRITLSTSGVVPMIEKCGEELGVNLAISLHAVTDDVRSQLIPLNKVYPIKDVIKACKNYPAASNTRRITFEYVMLKGINDSMADAKALVKLVSGLPAKINLLPFNPWPGSPYEPSDEATIKKFGEFVNRAGYASPVRTPRGRDIMAACGQLKSASQKKREG
jgi:23S rRNA (adenine2503-C2)-methyltransferase